MSYETPVHLPRAAAALPLHAAWRWHGGLTAAYASEAGSGRSTQEGSLAGRVSGLMWLLVAVTTPLALLLPGSDREPLWVVLLVCTLGAANGHGLLALARSGR